jgi:hypothetical protein
MAIAEVRPTQITVGYREVAEKRRRWRHARNTNELDILQRRIVPIVVGPSAACYVLDRHHWLSALTAEGVTDVPVVVVADLQKLDQATFWSHLDRRGWCRPYDAQGRRQDYCDIPSSIAGLQDDPFRSLASALRRAGEFAKHKTLFSEFAWADFLRCRIGVKDLEEDFDGALQAALVLSHGAAAIDLRVSGTADRSRDARSVVSWYPNTCRRWDGDRNPASLHYV